MLVNLDVPPLCLKTNSDGSRLVVGFVDGTIRFYDTTKGSEDEFEEIWKFQTKTSIRGVDLDEMRGKVYAITKNRALCVFEWDTGRRIRCILKCHDGIPSAICTLPPTALKSQQLATADETGQVKTWNLDAETPMIREWREQEEEINDLKVDVKTNLLATSSDGTMAAFDLRKAKVKVRSELMHSELFAVCGTNRSVYVGGEDGYVEVFNLNEYGNLLERIESGFEMGVNGIIELRSGLLGLTSGGSNKMRLLNVMPSKRLGIAGCHGDEKDDDDGIDAVTISTDKSTVFTMISMNQTIKKWDMAAIVNEVPILRAQDAKTKKKRKMEGFFDGMVDKKDEEDSDEDEGDSKKKRRLEDSDEEDSDEEDEDEEEEDEEEEDEDEEAEDEDSD
uniref:WD_REPEATS_REGION domain-containing protein n=1 Tax=Caenorhabditis tropicalis TaxID=1561998 RepID=A0A1I7TWQ7_9PELO